MAAFNHMTHRLISIPLNRDNFKKELNIIKQIAIKNGYKEQIIQTMVNKKVRKKNIIDNTGLVQINKE